MGTRLHVYFGKSHRYRQRQERRHVDQSNHLLLRCARQALALVERDFFKYVDLNEWQDLQNPIPRLYDDSIYGWHLSDIFEIRLYSSVSDGWIRSFGSFRAINLVFSP